MNCSLCRDKGIIPTSPSRISLYNNRNAPVTILDLHSESGQKGKYVIGMVCPYIRQLYSNFTLTNMMKRCNTIFFDHTSCL